MTETKDRPADSRCRFESSSDRSELTATERILVRVLVAALVAEIQAEAREERREDEA